MSYNVIVLPAAERDLSRLYRFLVVKSAAAASRAVEVLGEAIDSLGDFPLRTPVVANGPVRQLVVKFGHDGYVSRYRVTATEVHVSRIFHGKERR